MKLSKFDLPLMGSAEPQSMQLCNFRGCLGCLNYLAITTTPDIAHAAKIINSFVENPAFVENPVENPAFVENPANQLFCRKSNSFVENPALL